MKVLHVIETLEVGGAESFVAELVRATVSDCNPSICCLKRTGAMARRLPNTVPVFELGKREGVDLAVVWRLLQLIRSGSFTAIHSHMWGSYLESAIAAKLGGVRVVHTAHGQYHHRRVAAIRRVARHARRLMERLVAGWHHRIVAVSEPIMRDVATHLRLSLDSLETLHNGIEDHPSTPRPSSGQHFVTVGRLASVKNQALMIRALSNLKQDFPEARLSIVGEGPLRSSLEALTAELGVADIVFFLGQRDDVTSILQRSDVFLMSSRYEGISLAILEAMRAGLAVVATNVGGVANTVDSGVTGILVPDDDVDAFTQAMRQMLVDPVGRGRMGALGAERRAGSFSIAKTAARYVQLYAGCP